MKNILITGLPQSGKTTLIRKLALVFKEFNPAGFFTAELKKDGSTVGFAVSTLAGDSRIFAHVALKSRYKVGKYHVDMKGFEKFLEDIFLGEKKSNFYIIDEIGKMECASKKFSKLVPELLKSEKPVIATISEKGTGLIADIKKREDVVLYEVTPETLDLRLKELTLIIRDLLIE